MDYCETCEGTGELWWDDVDYRDRHVTRSEECPDCDPNDRETWEDVRMREQRMEEDR